MKNSHSLKSGFLAIGSFVLLTSCSFSSEPEPPTRAELAKQRQIANLSSDVEIEPFSSSEEATQTPPKEQEYGVELTWDIPEETIEYFIVYVGNSPEHLNTEIRLSVAELTVTTGNKYRYLVKPVNKGDPIYVALSAVSGGVASARSAVQRIDREMLVP